MKTFLALTMILLCQNAHAQTKFAIKGGWDLSTARVYENDIKQPSQFINGFNLAVAWNSAFDGPLHFAPVIGFSRRGYQYQPTNDSISQYQNTINYIDLIPALSMNLRAGKNTLVFSAGPQFGFAFSGTEKTTINGLTTTNKMKFAIDGDYGYIDLGLNAGVGLQMKKILLEINYQYGCANINNNVQVDGRNIQNRMISFDIGYFLK